MNVKIYTKFIQYQAMNVQIALKNILTSDKKINFI